MKLPRLKVILIPESHCLRCSQHGYTEEKSHLCLGCLNIAIAFYYRNKSAAVLEQPVPVREIALARGSGR